MGRIPLRSPGSRKTHEFLIPRQQIFKINNFALVLYFFLKRLAFAVARLCQGAMSVASDARPPLEIIFMLDSIAASAFSRTIRWYSAREHVSRAISSVRRAIVSQDASVRFVINKGRVVALRRLRAFMSTSTKLDAVAQLLFALKASNSNEGRQQVSETVKVADIFAAGLAPSDPIWPYLFEIGVAVYWY